MSKAQVLADCRHSFFGVNCSRVNCGIRLCVKFSAVLRLLGVMADFLYGDGPPVRPDSTPGVVSVWLSQSLSVPGRHLKKGVASLSPPPPLPLLAPTLGWPPRDGLVSSPQLSTPGWPLEERTDCVFVVISLFICLFVGEISKDHSFT